MMPFLRRILKILLLILFIQLSNEVFSQNNTQIRGFVDASTFYSNKKVSFGLGEQDLFITSDITDRLSFLGETVFKYDPSSGTDFSVSIERIVLKYNYFGNHNVLLGKHHTPINYWNDTYHHGRVFFPTIGRPLMFSTNLFPLHTTGLSLQGLNLGKLRFGYDILVGNGLGSSDIIDNDNNKSITAAVHIKPSNSLRIGLSYYRDVIAKGTKLHSGDKIGWKVNEHLVTGSIAHFGKKFEFLAESMLGITRTDTTGSQRSLSSYAYAGYKVTEKITPYARFDNLHYQDGEISFHKNNSTAIVIGGRYQLNYLAVIKLEYQHLNTEKEVVTNKISAQFAIGF
ncbi:MAG TPA: hypothetical protein VF622_18450 [Segetibacter sp.]|jgi:hypothetical protein